MVEGAQAKELQLTLALPVAPHGQLHVRLHRVVDVPIPLKASRGHHAELDDLEDLQMKLVATRGLGLLRGG